MTGRAVTDSTCLIALERIRRLGLLPQLFATVIAPPEVEAEFGILLQAKRRGLIPVVQPLLMALQEVGFRMTAALYDEALRVAGEEPRR